VYLCIKNHRWNLLETLQLLPVDHGKTTLVDKIMYHCQLFRDNENAGDLILDNNDLERERGITITSKMFR
jgi:predicted membrane GTPase involved in stress response